MKTTLLSKSAHFKRCRPFNSLPPALFLLWFYFGKCHFNGRVRNWWGRGRGLKHPTKVQLIFERSPRKALPPMGQQREVCIMSFVSFFSSCILLLWSFWIRAFYAPKNGGRGLISQIGFFRLRKNHFSRKGLLEGLKTIFLRPQFMKKTNYRGWELRWWGSNHGPLMLSLRSGGGQGGLWKHTLV